MTLPPSSVSPFTMSLIQDWFPSFDLFTIYFWWSCFLTKSSLFQHFHPYVRSLFFDVSSQTPQISPLKGHLCPSHVQVRALYQSSSGYSSFGIWCASDILLKRVSHLVFLLGQAPQFFITSLCMVFLLEKGASWVSRQSLEFMLHYSVIDPSTLSLLFLSTFYIQPDTWQRSLAAFGTPSYSFHFICPMTLWRCNTH